MVMSVGLTLEDAVFIAVVELENSDGLGSVALSEDQLSVFGF